MGLDRLGEVTREARWDSFYLTTSWPIVVVLAYLSSSYAGAPQVVSLGWRRGVSQVGLSREG